MPDDDLLNLTLGNNPNGPSASPFANSLGQGSAGSPPPTGATFLSQPAIPWPATPATATPASAYNPPPASSAMPSPPSASSGGWNLDPPTLSALMDSGVGASVIADMLPQLDMGWPSRAESLAYVTNAPLPGIDPSTDAPTSSYQPLSTGAGSNGSDSSSGSFSGLSGNNFVASQQQNVPAVRPVPLQSPPGNSSGSSPAPNPFNDAVMSPPFNMSPQQLADMRGQAATNAVVGVGLKYLLGPAADLALPELGVERILAQTIAKGIDTANHLSEPSDEQYIEGAPDKAVFKYLTNGEYQSIPSTAKRWIP